MFGELSKYVHTVSLVLTCHSSLFPKMCVQELNRILCDRLEEKMKVCLGPLVAVPSVGAARVTERHMRRVRASDAAALPAQFGPRSRASIPIVCTHACTPPSATCLSIPALCRTRACTPPSALPQGTRVEGMINRLFEGHTLNYLECINVEYKSSRKESFMDVQVGTGWGWGLAWWVLECINVGCESGSKESFVGVQVGELAAPIQHPPVMCQHPCSWTSRTARTSTPPLTSTARWRC